MSYIVQNAQKNFLFLVILPLENKSETCYNILVNKRGKTSNERNLKKMKNANYLIFKRKRFYYFVRSAKTLIGAKRIANKEKKQDCLNDIYVFKFNDIYVFKFEDRVTNDEGDFYPKTIDGAKPVYTV